MGLDNVITTRDWRRAPRKAYWRVRAFYRDDATITAADIIRDQMLTMDKTGSNDFVRWQRKRGDA